MKTHAMLLLVAALVAGCEQGGQLLVPVGAHAPTFSLQRLQGGEAHFPTDYRGQVVAIRFWADWCPYCRPEMRELEPIYRGYRERGLTMVAVNVMQPRSTVEAFVRDLGLSAEVLLDHDGSVTRAYGVMGLPVTVVVDREGVVRGRIIGESSTDTFVQVVSPVLGINERGDR